MTLPDELVTAVAEAIRCHCPPPYDECPHDDPRPFARDAVAAVLRALPECVVPAVWAHRMPSGNFHRFHDKNSVHMDGCIPLYDLGTIAKLADDE